MSAPDFRAAVTALLRQELEQHEVDLVDSEAEFVEYDNYETMHYIDVLKGRIDLLQDLIKQVDELPVP